MSGLVAIVPYRVDPEGLRRRNAEVVLRWLAEAGVVTVLAEHADVPDEELALPRSAARVLTRASGAPFNKSAACNAGFRAADADIIALVDADTLMPTTPFLACADAVADEFDVVRPFGRLLELDEAASAEVASGAPLPTLPAGGHDDDRGGERIPLCGGLVIMRGSAYASVGGMDEAFRGWGGEDDALSIALIRSGSLARINTGGVAVHLAHSRTLSSRYQHPDYAGNLERAASWHTMSDADFARVIEERSAAFADDQR